MAIAARARSSARPPAAAWRAASSSSFRAFRNAAMDVGVCTNATALDAAQIEALQRIGGVHCNVSLDGFRPGSHGKFRGDRDSFHTTIATVRALAAAGLLQGLLCTPNSLAEDDEYRELCQFAVQHGAQYVLLNPLSSMGRGVKSRGRLAATEERMRHIRHLTAPFDSSGLDIVHIRFPSTGQPLAGCQAGTIIYVFTSGEVTVCPYLVFAARTPQSLHDPADFIVGNIFTDADIAARLDAFGFVGRHRMGSNPTCRSCTMTGEPAPVTDSADAAVARCRAASCSRRPAVSSPGSTRSSSPWLMRSAILSLPGFHVMTTPDDPGR